VTIENLFQVQWKNDTFHLREFCRQPFHYNPLIYFDGYSELAASPNMHKPCTLKDYWKTWNILLLPKCSWDFQSPETLHSISGFFTDLEWSSCSRMLEILMLHNWVYALSVN